MEKAGPEPLTLIYSVQEAPCERRLLKPLGGQAGEKQAGEIGDAQMRGWEKGFL